MIDDEKQSFIDAYRDALGIQRDLAIQNLDNNRRNAYQAIMSGANKAGMMYSNFPERAKYQYDTSTYTPNLIKTQQTYQTGLDSLRSNVLKAINQLSELREASKELETSNKRPLGANVINDAGDWTYLDTRNVTQYRDANNDPIRLGHAAQNAGFSTPEQLLQYGKDTLSGYEWNTLNDIVKNAPAGYVLMPNWGDTYEEQKYDWLDDERNSWLNSWGLKFGQQ